MCEPDLITEGGADHADLFLLESGAGDEVQGGPALPAVIFTILFLHLIIGVEQSDSRAEHCWSRSHATCGQCLMFNTDTDHVSIILTSHLSLIICRLQQGRLKLLKTAATEILSTFT